MRLNSLKDVDACSEAVEWVGDRTLLEAAKDLNRLDWLFWYVAANSALNKEREKAVLWAGECLLHFEPGNRHVKWVKEALAKPFTPELFTWANLNKDNSRIPYYSPIRSFLFMANELAHHNDDHFVACSSALGDRLGEGRYPIGLAIAKVVEIFREDK